MAQGERVITQSGFPMGGTSNTSSFTDPKVTNPPFAYPRHLPQDNQIQRGYMRLLGQVLQANLGVIPETSAGEEAQRALADLGAKLDFQFNPNQLNRAVTARTDTQLWINQSPSELLTPGLGDMSFQWQMIFNREEEVQKYYNAQGRWSRSGVAAERINAQHLDALLKADPSDPRVAERIGILADIMVLDQITGQRLTEAAVTFAEKWSATASRHTDDDAEPDPDDVMSRGEKNDLISANMTNSAFLIPNPIRVVFSENFMVDGYVNTVAVSIQKFSPDMVPTVAAVDISMHALYQGFARQKTVFTQLAAGVSDGELEAGENPYDSESQNRVATAGTDTADWQALGMSGQPILAGFDHSPNDSGRNWLGSAESKLNHYKNVAGRKTPNVPHTGETLAKPLKGGGSLRMQLGDNDALLYGIVCNLMDSNLGRFIRNNGSPDEAMEYFNSMKDRLSVNVDVGVALRARLKATTKESLYELWMDGDENGFSTYHKGAQDYVDGEWEDSSVYDHHFFDRWSKEQRRNLFAVGIDTYNNTASSSVTRQGQLLKQTVTQASGFYTRSFPILELDDHPGYYGDHFYIDSTQYGPADINIRIGGNADEGWLWLGDKSGTRISSDQWQLSLARGFYDPTTNIGFPSQLTLVNAATNNVDHTYDILYQPVLTVRVRLLMTDPDSKKTQRVPISDTGVMWVYPRDEETGTINDVDGEGVTDVGVHNRIDLQGSPQGDEGDDITSAMKDREWITDVDKELYYDGLYGSNQPHPNMKRYGWYSLDDFSDASLGGMMISSANIRSNNVAVT